MPRVVSLRLTKQKRHVGAVIECGMSEFGKRIIGDFLLEVRLSDDRFHL